MKASWLLASEIFIKKIGNRFRDDGRRHEETEKTKIKKRRNFEAKNSFDPIHSGFAANYLTNRAMG